jgi:hypothetical protein
MSTYVLYVIGFILILMDNSNNVNYRKIQGIFNSGSLAVTLPQSYAVNIGLKKGDFVKVHQEDHRIIIEKA